MENHGFELIIVNALDEAVPSGNGTHRAVHDGVESAFTIRGIRTEPKIPNELLDQLITGPITQGEFETIF